MSKAMQAERKMWSKFYSYDEWMEAQGIPIYRGYYIEDLRTLELGWWRRPRVQLGFHSTGRPGRRHFGAGHRNSSRQKFAAAEIRPR